MAALPAARGLGRLKVACVCPGGWDDHIDPFVQKLAARLASRRAELLVHFGYLRREQVTNSTRTDFPDFQAVRQHFCPAQTYNVRRFTDHVVESNSDGVFWDRIHYTAPLIHKMNGLLLETVCTNRHHFHC